MAYDLTALQNALIAADAAASATPNPADPTSIANIASARADAAQLAAEIKRQQALAQPSVMDSLPYKAAADDTSPIGAGLAAAGHWLDNKADGLQQMVRSGLQAIGFDQAQPTADLNADMAQKNAAYAALQQAHPFMTFLGDAAPSLVTKNPLVMAGMAAMDPGSPTDRAENATGAFIGGKIGQGVGKVVGRAMGGPQSMSGVPNDIGDFFATDASAGNKWGIPLTAGQASDSQLVKAIESVAGGLPGGGAITAGRNASASAFNKAVAQTMGEDTSEISPDMLGRAKARIGGTIGTIASRNAIGVDAPLFQDLTAAGERAAQELTPDDANIVNKQLQNIWNAVDPTTGAIPGTMYKAIQSKLGEIGKANGGTISSVMGDMRTGLRDAMTRSVSPDDADAWLKANGQYFNMRQIADATKATPGELSPSKLLTQVNAAQSAARFGGGNDLAELAQFGKANLPDTVPNSGTAQRSYIQNVITNPSALLGGMGVLGGATVGAHEAGFSGDDIGGGLAGAAMLPFLIGRGMGARPVSAATQSILQRLGGSSGAEAAAQALRRFRAAQ